MTSDHSFSDIAANVATFLRAISAELTAVEKTILEDISEKRNHQQLQSIDSIDQSLLNLAIFFEEAGKQNTCHCQLPLNKAIEAVQIAAVKDALEGRSDSEILRSETIDIF